MISELHEVVRVRATAAEPMHEGLVVYRQGIHIMWNILLDTATDTERQMLLEQADILWSYLELVIDAFAQAYADEQDAPATVGERRAKTLLDGLSARRPLTVDDRERAEFLGFDLAGLLARLWLASPEPPRPITSGSPAGCGRKGCWRPPRTTRSPVCAPRTSIGHGRWTIRVFCWPTIVRPNGPGWPLASKV